MSEIDWSQVSHGLFLTLTLPDECWPISLRGRTILRHRMLRDVERHLHHQFAALWRIEWKPRQSGRWQRNTLPHWHMIIPGVKYIGHEVVRELWGKVLGHDGPLATDVQALSSERHQKVYVAKYAAKPADVHSLDSVVHLNTGGRHWGIHRRNLLPLHPKTTYQDLPSGTVARLRRIATQNLKHYDPRYDAGFVLFGELGAKVAAEVDEILLDSGVVPE